MNSFDKTLAYTYLFYLLTNADGKVDEKEMNLGITMVKHENLDAAKFDK